MTRLSFILCVVARLSPAAATLDRIVAVVGRRAIKQSDLERDIRVTQFLNNSAPDSGPQVQKEALERLIDQELIRSDMGTAANTGYLHKEAKALYDRLLLERFGGSKARFDAELSRRRLKESQLLDQLQWQLIVLRFIDQRFRPGVIVTEEEIRRYYDGHRQEFQSAGRNVGLEEASPSIRENLEAEGINRNFEEWLREARKAAVVRYKVDALK